MVRSEREAEPLRGMVMLRWLLIAASVIGHVAALAPEDFEVCE